MIDNIKAVKLELDSIKFINKLKKNGEYEEFTSRNQVPVGKFETLKITPETIKEIDPNNKLLNNVNFQTVDNSCNSCYNLNIENLNDKINKQLNVRDQIFRPYNLPTMTLDEFADKEIVRMEETKRMEDEAKVKSKLEAEEDQDRDEIDLKKKVEASQWDDWKDLHEKGGGNKKKY